MNWPGRSCITELLAVFIAVLFLLVLARPDAGSQTKRIYLANDDHTDLMWAGDEGMYSSAWLTMLDYYINQADTSAGSPADFHGRFNADGNYWLWIFEKNRSGAQFQHLMDRIADGHITIPLQTLVMTYGGMPTEAVIRSMAYAGRIERRYNLRFELACAMEDATLPFGLPSLWAGSGAKYSWKGLCGCYTAVPGLSNRGREIYYAVGPDGRSVLMKWHSLYPGNNKQSGGYAENRGLGPAGMADFLTTDPTFLSRWPNDSVVGAFGWGWDDLKTTTEAFISAARSKSDAQKRVIVSNETDFFRDYESSTPPGITPSYSASFGNDWDGNVGTMAEVTASVKRATERLRSAEGLATLVSLANPSFTASFSASRDSAFNNLGLYFEHNWNNDGVYSSLRPAFNRAKAAQITSYVSRLNDSAAAALGRMIQKSGSSIRFYVFNPLSWTRTDVADFEYSPPGSFKVVDVSSGSEVRSQLYVMGGKTYVRIRADSVPSVGYRVFEIQNGQSQFSDSVFSFSNGNTTFENDQYRIVVNGAGAITSLVDKLDGAREWVQTISSRTLNDVGSGSGTPVQENVGKVSATLFVDAGGTPAHRVRITLYDTLDRIDIQDEITQNFFGDPPVYYGFGFNLTGQTTRHEEVGAVAVAKLTSDGGNYSPSNARYSYLTMNHFVDLSNQNRGVTLSNWDSQFFQLGSSTATTLDETTPQIKAIVGGKLAPSTQGFGGQDGDSYFLNRYALQTHGPYDQAAAMRMALEHQNPFVARLVSGEDPRYPGTSFSLLSIADPRVILWALKPAEEGIGDPATGGVIARVWNLGEQSATLMLTVNGDLQNASKTTHIETPSGSVTAAGATVIDLLPSQWMQTYRLNFQLKPVGVNDQRNSTRDEGFLLGQNYPNPFNPDTNIPFYLSRSAQIILRLYDLLGREVALLAEGHFEPGLHRVVLNAHSLRLASGPYFYRMSVDGLMNSRSLMLLR